MIQVVNVPFEPALTKRVESGWRGLVTDLGNELKRCLEARLIVEVHELSAERQTGRTLDVVRDDGRAVRTAGQNQMNGMTSELSIA